MNWKSLLHIEIEYTSSVVLPLIRLVEPADLDWKPATGENWLDTSQLLHHLATGMGHGFKGFVKGDWGIPVEDMTPEAMLPPADAFPHVASVEEAVGMFEADKKMALDILAETTEDDLANKVITAPWDPTEMVLGHRLTQMIEHVKVHKAQLFYYLKLQGKPVNTFHLWGMD